MSSPPMLTLPLWSSNASHMIISRKMLKRVGESRHSSNSYCSSEPFSCAAIEQDCTLGLVIQIFNGSYDTGVDVVFPYSCSEGFVSYPVKGLLEVYEDMIEILLMLMRILRLNICSVVLLPALKPDLFFLWLESV